MSLNLLGESILNLGCAPRPNIGVKNHVNFLKRPSRGLRIHEEDLESHDKAEHGEYHIRPPLDVVEGRRNEVGQSEIEDPVSCGGEADAFGTVFQREDFGCVDPGGRGLLIILG